MSLMISLFVGFRVDSLDCKVQSYKVVRSNRVRQYLEIECYRSGISGILGIFLLSNV